MSPYVSGMLAVLVVWHIAFVVAAVLKRNDLADVLWGPGFLVAALGTVLGAGGGAYLGNLQIAEWILLSCVGIWGLRLAFHIGQRVLRSHEEDARYANWRKEWGNVWLIRTYFQVFILQAFFLIVISIPVLRAIAFAPRAVTVLFGLGLFVWVFGFLFESISDEQLRRFKSNPKNKGRLMDHGLWSWSRHPNYFGEVVQWWGIFLMAMEPGGWWTVISPMTITFLILKISGVPMLEKLMQDRKGFQDYARKTSLFFPRPPKS